MPIYEYRCLDCSNRFEIMHLASKKEDAVCSKCGSKKTEKLISSFSALGSSGSSDSCDTGSCDYPSTDGYSPCSSGTCPM